MDDNHIIRIKSKLKGLRALRFFSHFPWLMMIVTVAIVAVLPAGTKEDFLPIYQFFFLWSIGGFFLSFALHSYKCPRCKNQFHFKRHGKGFLSWYMYNDFAKGCMHCGLKLNGSNASEKYEL